MARTAGFYDDINEDYIDEDDYYDDRGIFRGELEEEGITEEEQAALDAHLNSVLQASLTSVIKKAGGKWDDATNWYLSEHGVDLDMEDNEQLQVVLDHVSQDDWDPDFGKPLSEQSVVKQANARAGYSGIKLGVTPYVNTKYPEYLQHQSGHSKSPGNYSGPSQVQQDDFGGNKPTNIRGVKGVVKARQSPNANNMGRIRNASKQQTSQKQMRIR